MFEQCAVWRAVYATNEIAQRLGADWDRVILAPLAKWERHLKSANDAYRANFVGKITSENFSVGLNKGAQLPFPTELYISTNRGTSFAVLGSRQLGSMI